MHEQAIHNHLSIFKKTFEDNVTPSPYNSKKELASAFSFYDLSESYKDDPNQNVSMDYLISLLKEKKQLLVFPGFFPNVDRLLDEEISRVRMSLFQCDFSNDEMQLPEPEGEVVAVQEKIYVPNKEHPDYNFVGRILGPRGMTAKQLEQETSCKIMVRGRGSMRDRKKEEANRGKQNWEHLEDELHVLIQCEDTQNRAKIKISNATRQINKLLVPAPEGADELKRKQLMELAIINGTYRSVNNTKFATSPTRLVPPINIIKNNQSQMFEPSPNLDSQDPFDFNRECSENALASPHGYLDYNENNLETLIYNLQKSMGNSELGQQNMYAQSPNVFNICKNDSFADFLSKHGGYGDNHMATSIHSESEPSYEDHLDIQSKLNFDRMAGGDN
uniref:KH domain-containing protein n=1 Tax=Rhabditophanes sp. KR3021 TaxID=114890 RepID=A0AC35UIN8_9BILA